MNDGYYEVLLKDQTELKKQWIHCHKNPFQLNLFNHVLFFFVLTSHPKKPERLSIFIPTRVFSWSLQVFQLQGRRKCFRMDGSHRDVQLYICVWKGSEQVKMSLVWFAGNINVDLMLRSSPVKATKTLLSRFSSVMSYEMINWSTKT